MRMWNVHPSILCRKHLLGEHVEMHMFVGVIAAGKSIAGFIRDGLVDTADIKNRHDELVREMQRRGMKHNSPLHENPTTERRKTVDHNKSLDELVRRCVDCRAAAEKLYGWERFALIPKGGDLVFALNGLHVVQYEGKIVHTGLPTREKAMKFLEDYRRSKKQERAAVTR